jgi:ribonuclease VapC
VTILDDVVLDASAVMAAMRYEPGGDAVRACADRALVSAVNLSEVATKLAERGVPDADIATALGGLGFDVVAASLRVATRRAGLSLGDRACLALAKLRRLPVMTADKAWAGLDLGVEIALIR